VSRPVGCARALLATVLLVPTIAGGERVHLAVLARPVASSIKGAIVNASSGKPGGKLAVILSGARPGGTLTTTARATTDIQGRFTFKVVPAAGVSYVVSTVYRGVLYGASVPPTALGSGHPVSVTIYDTVAGDGDLLAVTVSVGVKRTGATLAVGEQWTLVNSDYRLAGAAPLTFHGVTHIALPDGATGVRVRSIDPDLQAAPAGGALAISGTVRPATGNNPASYHTIFFTFDLALPRGATHPTLPIGTRYPLGRLNVFSLSDTIDAPGFALSPFSNGGKLVKGYLKVGLSGGDTVHVGVDGPPAALPAIAGVVAAGPNVRRALPAAATAPAAVPVLQPVSYPVAAVLIAAGAGFGLLLILGLLGRGPVRVGTRRGDGASTQARVQREYARLVVAIAELDLRHEQGVLATPDYERRRAREKSRLLDLSRRLER